MGNNKELKEDKEILEIINDIFVNYEYLKREPHEYSFYVKANDSKNYKIDYKNFNGIMNKEIGKEKILSFYFHYPFCSKLCNYCHYIKFKYNKKLQSEISELMHKEFNIFSNLFPDISLKKNKFFIFRWWYSFANRYRIFRLFSISNNKVFKFYRRS